MARNRVGQHRAALYDCAKLPARAFAQIPHMAYIRPYRSSWRAEVQRNGQRTSKTFDTKRQAQAWATEQEGTAKRLGAGWRTFGQAVAEYEASHTTRKRSQQWERNTFARLVAAIGEATPLGAIDSSTIARWRDARLATVSGSTVQREANLLRNLFTVARDEWRWIEHNPFQGVKLPKENAPRTAVWTWQLIKRVLRAPRTGKTAEVQRAFRISLHTAMRLSEVLTARYDARRRVAVLDSTKAGQAQEVPIVRRAVKLFPATFTVNPNEASTLFSKLCAQLLIEGLTFHDARASAATWLARRTDVMTLAKITRHKDIRILQNTYYRETAEQISARL